MLMPELEAFKESHKYSVIKHFKFSSSSREGTTNQAFTVSEIVEAVASDCFPNQLCNYLHEVVSTFMRFYEECPILSEKEGSRFSINVIQININCN